MHKGFRNTTIDLIEFACFSRRKEFMQGKVLTTERLGWQSIEIEAVIPNLSGKPMCNWLVSLQLVSGLSKTKHFRSC
jgi:hypothetical protein